MNVSFSLMLSLLHRRIAVDEIDVTLKVGLTDRFVSFCSSKLIGLVRELYLIIALIPKRQDTNTDVM